MTIAPKVSVSEIILEDSAQVSAFLHENLNRRVPAARWAELISPPWGSDRPNHGFQLRTAEGELVGVYVAVYSRRFRDGAEREVCNLAAFCVLEEHRVHSLRLVRAILAQKHLLFTDLSPSGNVPAMNKRLGFTELDTATRLSLNVSRPFARTRGVTDDPRTLEQTLTGHDAVVFEDHRAARAARHLLILDDSRYAYLIYRRDRRKRLGVFASPLYVGGDPAVLQAKWPDVAAHLRRRGYLATLAERRILGFTPRGPGRDLAHPRPKMYRGELPAGETVDYLYSELTLLGW
ncbi:hypothetical protein [Microbacterium pumilum]|uniref:N-acetyltransferase domain-containing protein n=1 Tax=Microbacterium pumilum TaxID=344165 RepID=A0ABN2S1Y0_9MICO